MEAVPKLAGHILTEMSKIIVGQERLKTECLIVLLCEGHALVEGVPGLAKTLAVSSLSRGVRGTFARTTSGSLGSSGSTSWRAWRSRRGFLVSQSFWIVGLRMAHRRVSLRRVEGRFS